MYYFSKSDLDGGSGVESDPISVRFQGGGTAKINGGIKFRLPSADPMRLKINQDFKSYEALKHDLVRQVVAEALAQTATLMKAEESYSTRRAEFTSLVEEQVKNGIYETDTKESKVKDAEGNELVDREVFIKRDASGTAIIRKDSPFKSYGIEIISFQLKDFDFDDNITALIHQKQDAEQKKVVARANAEKAQQDAITAKAEGDAKVATELATQQVEKIKQVTIAERELEVAQKRRLQAEQDAQATIVNGKALAEVNRLKVVAGLTPLEKATIQKETAIGVAEQLANVQFPAMMNFGGGANSPTDPFQAIGLESFMRLSAKLAGSQDERTESHNKRVQSLRSSHATAATPASSSDTNSSSEDSSSSDNN
jgi:regulator of protease activity HflC (stomatin/prohibitin superfamily)